MPFSMYVPRFKAEQALGRFELELEVAERLLLKQPRDAFGEASIAITVPGGDVLFVCIGPNPYRPGPRFTYLLNPC